MAELDIHSAEVELACADLAGALAALTRLGFRVGMVMPADDPQIATLSGHGVRLRLVRGALASGTLRLACADPPALGVIDAGGIRVELVAERAALVMPALAPAFVVTRDEPAAWRLGRAGMLYRDLIPDRQGGRFIASHIRVPDGGPVADYVHHHAIRFQMIYCYKGWVRLVYEDQGEPFQMAAGDCVMQPPHIRHRVLECSPGLEVIEISTPAVHETHADHDTPLPTPSVVPDRDFGGQRFALHRAHGGFTAAALGIATASGGLASARVHDRAAIGPCTHDAELLFGFVLQGELSVTCDDRPPARLAATDAFAIPAGSRFAISEGSAALAWLEVTLPARVAYDRVG